MMCNNFSRLHDAIFCLLSIEEHPVFWSVYTHIFIVAWTLHYYYFIVHYTRWFEYDRD